MHFRCDVPKKEGIYHIRIYDIANPAHEWQEMYIHSDLLYSPAGLDLATQVRGDLVLDQGFGDMQNAVDSELFIGQLTHQNFKISFEADSVLSDFVASWRDLTKEIWCEIVLEQWAENLPELIPFQHVIARKKRSVFWGRMVRNEATGNVAYQKYTTGLLRDPKVSFHIGSLDVGFIQWMHVRFPMSIEAELLQFIHPFDIAHGGTAGNISLAKLLEFVAEHCSPTALVSITDASLIETPTLDPNVQCQFTLPYVIEDDSGNATRNLLQLAVAVSDGTTGFFWPLFSYDSSPKKDHGKYSLFTLFKTSGDALMMMAREFFLRFDCEIPLLEDTNPRYGSPFIANTRDNRAANWKQCTRWIFSEPDLVPLEITAEPLQGSVKYNPAAVWISHLKVQDPIVDFAGFVDTVAEFTNVPAEGKDISYSTIFRFVGQIAHDDNPAHNTESPQFGTELLIDKTLSGGAVTFATNAHFDAGFYPRSLAWSAWHVVKQLDRWGGARAIVEFEHAGVGIAPFGGDVLDFGFPDYGDYRVMRKFAASPGLLYQGSDFAVFSVFEISSTPGGTTKIRGIERKIVTPVTPTFPPQPVAPPPVTLVVETPDTTLDIDNTTGTPETDELDRWTLDTDKTYYFFSIVCARRTGGSGAGAVGDSLTFELKGGFKNVADVVTIVGSDGSKLPYPDMKDDEAMDIEFDIDGTDIVLKVTTPAQEHLLWNSTTKIYGI